MSEIEKNVENTEAQSEPQNVELDSEETNLHDVIKNLDTSSLEPDREVTTEDPGDSVSASSSVDESGSTSASPGPDSLSRSSSTTSSQKELVSENGVAKLVVAKASVEGKTKDKTPSPTNQKSKLKNPLSIFKKKSPKVNDENDKDKQLDKMLAAVKIETLPQLFVTKYLGFKTTRGLYGTKYTREPLRDLLSEASSSGKEVEIPLTQLHISKRGIHVTEHKQNKVKDVPIDSGLIPIEFISYGVQDINYTRIFTFIIVREMSSRSRKLECHAYLCDSSVTCRKLALSVALAFQQYAKTLDGKPHKFQVDLRPMGEIEHDLTKGEETNGDENITDDCDA